MTKLSLQDISLKDQRVLMRVDFNVPLNDEGTISDDSRIRATIPSIEYILNQGARLILMSHLGRPKGKKVSALSLKPCAKRLSKLMQKPVAFVSDCVGEQAENAVKEITSGDILLLENLRFHEAEEHPEKDASFAKKLAELGDIYVNDAFGSSHRKHSSTYTVVQYFPKKAVSGFLLDKEIAFLGSVVQQPKRPFYTILGGAKVSTKIGVIRHLIEKIDSLFIGGGMAYTFLKSQGFKIGDSIFEEDFLNAAKEVFKTCQEKAVKLYLPSDLVIAKTDTNFSESKVVSVKEGISEGWEGVDIGPKTIEEWRSSLKEAATIFWNGPLGIFENPSFAIGTNEIAKTLSSMTATTIVGGGDSVAAIQKLNLSEKFTHLSTGGGASLEYLEYGHLPGIDVLCNR